MPGLRHTTKLENRDRDRYQYGNTTHYTLRAARHTIHDSYTSHTPIPYPYPTTVDGLVEPPRRRSAARFSLPFPPPVPLLNRMPRTPRPGACTPHHIMITLLLLLLCAYLNLIPTHPRIPRTQALINAHQTRHPHTRTHPRTGDRDRPWCRRRDGGELVRAVVRVRVCGEVGRRRPRERVGACCVGVGEHGESMSEWGGVRVGRRRGSVPVPVPRGRAGRDHEDAFRGFTCGSAGGSGRGGIRVRVRERVRWRRRR
ncbi:hypothetical protein JB92DRAFT_639102 [Gautieria morchelliformis]|nr:hypothetical protein JB92DRAFT_639102 [Gautieria morchelliformis]